MTNPNPTPFDLAVLGLKGRIERLMREKQLSYVDAFKEILKSESPQEYDERNARALQATIDRIQSPEYLNRMFDMMADPDPASKAAKYADLMRSNFEGLDLEALRRHIRDRNKELDAKGIISPQTGL